MEYRTLGTSDLKVSVIGLGTNNFGNPARITDPAVSKRVIDACLDNGINLIDTSNNYGGGHSEEHIGAALKGKREKAIIASKYNLRDLNGQSIADRVNTSVEESLRKLQTDHLDLYQLHFSHPEASQEQILEPLNKLVEQGKVRFIGECNYPSWRHAQADHVSAQKGWARMVSSQGYYNVLRRQAELELLPFCSENNVGFLPYFPLAGGWLTGKYKGTTEVPSGARRMVGQLQGNERAEAVLDGLTIFAKERGYTVLDLAFAWLLAHPAVSSVIAGAMNPEQVASNAAAARWVMTKEERAEVDAIAAWDGTGEEVEGFGPGGRVPVR
ncbi:MAG: aldo/keto reductase [Chloroflexota bacterium]